MKGQRANKKYLVAFREAHPICHYCVYHPTNGRDHKLASINGGTSVPENIVPACRACNMIKGRRDYDEFVFLFNLFLGEFRGEYQQIDPLSFDDIRKWQSKFGKWANKYAARKTT